MPNTELLMRLRELHEELSSMNDDLKNMEEIGQETIDALGELVSDVSELADQADAAQRAHTELEEEHDLSDRILQFRADHPRVTRFLSQITDVLAMMGI